MSDAPRFTSKSTVKSLWQEYRIYDDRVEFDTAVVTAGLSSRMIIPFEHIERVEVRESDVKGLLKGDLQLKNFRPAFKLDWANFMEHVVIDKSDGRLRRILFTPEDPTAFKHALDAALAQFGDRRQSGS